MNNAQDMSPDFVLMRLVSVAEDDRLDAENGNLPPGGVVAGLGKEVLAHSGVKAGLDISRDPTEGLQHPSSHLNKAQPSTEGTAAPDSGVTESRATLSAPPPPQSSMEAQAFDFAPSPGLRPQLLVFSNIMRNGEGILELDRRNQPRDALDQSPGSGCSSPAVNNNTLSVREVQQQQQNLLDRTWGAHSPASVEMQGAAELCHRHRLIATTPEWPVLTERSNPLTVIDSKWGCATRDREGAVFELARRFGELGVGAVPKMLFKAGELPHCSCQSAHRPAGGEVEPGDDPTETSDALLVLEGLGNGDVDGLDMDECPEDETDDENGRREFLLNRKREIVQKMSGAFSISSFQVELRRQVEETATEAAPAAHIATQVCSLHGNLSGRLSQVSCGNTEVVTHASAKSSSTTPAQSSPWATSPNLSQASTPRRRPERCASAPRTPTGRATGGEKMLKVPGKSKKGSLKIRLSKLFRTKSCSGSSHLLDKRPSVTYSVSSAGSLVDMACAAGAEQDADSHSQPRLTRAHSAFSPASLSASLSTFTGETVSLVDVDISQRGANTPHPHPPTPPPPPRRSLSLLDDIAGPQPGPFLVSVMGASLQSLPLPLPPPPPPSHTTIQHSLSLNDAFLRALPHSNPSSADAPPPIRQAPPPMLCALRRSEASNFTASLRELEKVLSRMTPKLFTEEETKTGTFSLWCHPKFEDRCHSVVEFIERAIMHSKNGKFLYFLRSRVPGLPPTPVQLLYPVSRFSNVKSLQHLCRFCIRQIVRIDHIQELPLPRPLISYLSKFYYYDPEEEMYLSIKSIRRVVGVGQEAESQT
ncbi:suppressor of cytokine signaling 7 [Neolamprologus brichardi]|uniref:suppressor of cytokine signaling 7 n=1 Tax=Neolamprologus brichardi TaxID=32507 RepID=UPI0003EBD2EA|nr:suppressor of cytokine signaling 7 [Neolamprologus brichardi]